MSDPRRGCTEGSAGEGVKGYSALATKAFVCTAKLNVQECGQQANMRTGQFVLYIYLAFLVSFAGKKTNLQA
jgi:hypothetical protein